MRIVSYNILNGGEGRADPLAEVLVAQRPDIIALVEAENADVVDRIALRVGMDVFHAKGPRHAAAILSRWPIAETIDHAAIKPAISKSFLEAVVVDPATSFRWHVGVVHLHAKATEADEQKREREIQVVLDTFAPRRRERVPHLLIGDFNANSPIQQIDPARCKPATRQAWEANGGQIPRRVVATILGAGYVDSLHVVDEEAARTSGSFTTQYPGQRLDYVFAFGFDTSRVCRASIEHDRLAKYASDHFPVGAEIE